MCRQKKKELRARVQVRRLARQKKFTQTFAGGRAAGGTRVDDIRATSELFLQEFYQRIFAGAAPTFKYDERSFFAIP